MNFEATFAEWTARCRQLARQAREDAARAEELDHLNPDSTLPLTPKTPSRSPHKS